MPRKHYHLLPPATRRHVPLLLLTARLLLACACPGAERDSAPAAAPEQAMAPGAFAPERPADVSDRGQAVSAVGGREAATSGASAPPKKTPAIKRFWSRFLSRDKRARLPRPMASIKVTLSAGNKAAPSPAIPAVSTAGGKSEERPATEPGKAAAVISTDLEPDLDEPGFHPTAQQRPGRPVTTPAGVPTAPLASPAPGQVRHAAPAQPGAGHFRPQADPAPRTGAEAPPDLDALVAPAPVAPAIMGSDADAAPAPPATADDAQPAAPIADENATVRYRVRPDDKLEISIPYEDDTRRIVSVQPDGYIRYLFDIEVLAAGKTYREIHNALLAKLRRFYKNPRVTVIGTSFQGNSVFVMGPVAKPGPHIIHRGTRLLDVLSSAGVLSLLPRSDNLFDSGKRREVVDLEGAYVARDDRILEVDFVKLLMDRDLKHYNILLRPGDFIFIPSTLGSEKKVYIVGRVATPQVYYYTGTLTFMQAMLEAGGADTDNTGSSASGGSRDTARTRTCYIVRKNTRKPIVVDWAKVQMAKAPDVPLQNGDIIYVPERPLSYGSRVTTRVINEILAPLKAILRLDGTTKDYYRHDWEFHK